MRAGRPRAAAGRSRDRRRCCTHRTGGEILQSVISYEQGEFLAPSLRSTLLANSAAYREALDWARRAVYGMRLTVRRPGARTVSRPRRDAASEEPPRAGSPLPRRELARSPSASQPSRAARSASARSRPVVVSAMRVRRPSVSVRGASRSARPTSSSASVWLIDCGRTRSRRRAHRCTAGPRDQDDRARRPVSAGKRYSARRRRIKRPMTRREIGRERRQFECRCQFDVSLHPSSIRRHRPR